MHGCAGSGEEWCASGVQVQQMSISKSRAPSHLERMGVQEMNMQCAYIGIPKVMYMTLPKKGPDAGGSQLIYKHNAVHMLCIHQLSR